MTSAGQKSGRLLRSLAVLLSAMIPILSAASSDAQVSRVYVRQVDNGGAGNLAGTVTNDLFIDFSGELRGQSIMLDLVEGSVYEHPLGTHLPPDPTLFEDFPNLAFDTFLTMGGADSLSSRRVLEVGKAVDLGLNATPTFGVDFIMAAWAPGTGVAIIDESDFFTARITLSNDAQGSWSYFGAVDGAEREFTGGTVVNGVMAIPEPRTACLAWIACFAIPGMRSHLWLLRKATIR